jgi:hypothetical protein
MSTDVSEVRAASIIRAIIELDGRHRIENMAVHPRRLNFILTADTG